MRRTDEEAAPFAIGPDSSQDREELLPTAGDACPRCAQPLYAVHCKLICENCGLKFTCDE